MTFWWVNHLQLLVQGKGVSITTNPEAYASFNGPPQSIYPILTPQNTKLASNLCILFNKPLDNI